MKMFDESLIDVGDILTTSGIFTIFGPIETDIARHTVEFITAHNLIENNSSKKITLMINSEGGNLCDAFAIINAIKKSKMQVETIGTGEISSAALMIFMSGTKGMRSVFANTSVMSHQWNSNVSGKMHELKSAQSDFALIQQRVMNHYIEHCSLTRKQINKLLLPPHDVFISAENAVAYGLADKVEK